MMNDTGTTDSCPDAADNPYDDPARTPLCQKSGVTFLNGGDLKAVAQLPLPGIVIFVHGVNSDGEWYDQTEEGLCAGLNARLKRCDEHLAHPTTEGGQLRAPVYTDELSEDGFINAKRDETTFIRDDNHFSPVIRFRWGYRASLAELQKYGDGVYLNEKDYWGGGPFANGCTALPDLWSEGLSENLFLWVNVQHVNPMPDRYVFSCPPRPYFVLAALRLAKLIESIRKLQANVPVTLVCHSQGNMIGMAAAFLGDRMPAVTDAAGVTGRCVADSYVLCNAPYSLVASNQLESWSELHMKDRHGGNGRQTVDARFQTLRAFFDIVREPASPQQKAEDIDRYTANRAHGFDTKSDRQACGYGTRQETRGRVTLYCNPHDQVISGASIQGIGWRGLSQKEIAAAGGTGTFCQRVFAQGVNVGVKREYHFWRDHYRRLDAGSPAFWLPESPRIRYSASKGMDSNRNWASKVLTAASTVFMIPIAGVAGALGARINALPDKDWSIPIDAPELPTAFTPASFRFGKADERFDERFNEREDAAGQRRDDTPTSDATDVTTGQQKSEATQRYEEHARLRMLARRAKLVKPGEPVRQEDEPETASAEFKAWREEEISSYLRENIDVNATDHSTIMTNPMHAEKALAYDVAVGMCRISPDDLRKLRIAADWRLWKGLDNGDSQKPLGEYFESGNLNSKPIHAWANAAGSEGGMPEKIEDRREYPAPPPYRVPGD